MSNEREKFTRLTLDQSDLHLEWSVPYEDVDGEQMLQALRTLMIGMTFSDSTIEHAMASYLEEYSEKYGVYDKDDADEIEEIEEQEQEKENDYVGPVRPHYYA